MPLSTCEQNKSRLQFIQRMSSPAVVLPSSYHFQRAPFPSAGAPASHFRGAPRKGRWGSISIQRTPSAQPLPEANSTLAEALAFMMSRSLHDSPGTTSCTARLLSKPNAARTSGVSGRRSRRFILRISTLRGQWRKQMSTMTGAMR